MLSHQIFDQLSLKLKKQECYSVSVDFKIKSIFRNRPNVTEYNTKKYSLFFNRINHISKNTKCISFSLHLYLQLWLANSPWYTSIFLNDRKRAFEFKAACVFYDFLRSVKSRWRTQQLPPMVCRFSHLLCRETCRYKASRLSKLIKRFRGSAKGSSKLARRVTAFLSI